MRINGAIGYGLIGDGREIAIVGNDLAIDQNGASGLKTQITPITDGVVSQDW